MAKDNKLRRYVIVVRKTRAKEIRTKYASKSLARFVMEERGESYDSYESEEKILDKSLDQIQAITKELGPTLVLERSLLSGTPLLEDDIILCLGQDGLVANTMRYAKTIPIFGINPSKSKYEGVLLKFTPESLKKYLLSEAKLNFKNLKTQNVTLAQCELSSGATLIASNDIFIGKTDHSSALYRIEYQNKKENQSSSGIIISTPMGSTGWQRSIVQGAAELMKSIGGIKKTLKFNPPPLESPKLRFWVREPWPSIQSQATLVCGQINKESPLNIISEMGEGGTIFADGMTSDAYPFPAGTWAKILPAPFQANLVLP